MSQLVKKFLADGAVDNAKVAASANIAVNKLAATTASRALVSDGSGFLSASAVTATELGYISGVTSAVQTQIDGKQSNLYPSVVVSNDSNFEVSIGSWVTYADAAGTAPVDGTGGTATSTFTRTTTGGEVLSGTASAKLSKDAANRQGEGASLTVSIPEKFRGQPCLLSFALKTSANFDFGTPFSSADPSDVTVWFYDVTNSVLIQPSPSSFVESGKYQGSFQIPSSCTSGRIILHITTTNALAYDVEVDDVALVLSPNQTVGASSDWESYTPTFTGFGTATNIEFKYRKNGPNIEILGKFTSGTSTATEARISLPTGLVSGDTTTIPSIRSVGNFTFAGNGAFAGYVLIEPSVTYMTFSRQDASRNSLTKQNGDLFFNSTAQAVWASFPIKGWTSGQATAASANLNAPVIFDAYKNAGSITANTTIPTWTTVNRDTVSAFDSSTGVYTVKVPGDYFVNFNMAVTASSASHAVIRKNGTAVLQSSAGVAGTHKQASIILSNLVIGDTITVASTLSETITSSNIETTLSISRIEMNGRVYATRAVYLKDLKSSGTNGGTFTSGSYQTRTLNTTEGDTSFVSLSSNQFTLQPGTYKIEASAPAYAVGLNKVKLRNTTDSSDTIIGDAAFSNTSNGHSVSTLTGVFSITAAKTFEIQHRCATTLASTGFGQATSFGDSEVYAQVKIEKVL